MQLVLEHIRSHLPLRHQSAYLIPSKPIRARFTLTKSITSPTSIAPIRAASILPVANTMTDDHDLEKASECAAKSERELRNKLFAKQDLVRASFILPPDFALSTQPISNGPDILESLQGSLSEDKRRELIYSRVLLLKEEGDAYVKTGDHDNALLCYRNIFNEFLGERNPLAQIVFNEDYMVMLKADMKKGYRFPIFLTLISCCNSIAEIHQKREEYINAIDWLEEVEVLYCCLKAAYSESHPAFLKIQKTLEYVTYRMKAASQLVRIFAHLQNTSAAAFLTNLCNKYYPRRYPPDILEICDLKRECNAAIGSYLEHKHPDPNDVSAWDIKDTSLQVRGVWSKITARPSLRPTKRHHRNTWIWRNKLYIAFGVLHRDGKTDCADDGDAWCIDVDKMDRWRRLPEIPVRLQRPPAQAEKHVVFGDYAWFFTGRLGVLRFNMVTETWDIAQTYADFSFPYGPYFQYDFYVELYGNKLCVFGGSEDFLMLGTRIFMLLDLETLKWEDLLQNFTLEEKDKIPFVRYASITWVSSKEDRFFLMYGCEADQKPPKDPMKPFRSCIAIFDELWSYGFREKMWKKERLRGNFPTHRISSICAYHEKKDKFVLFGGLTDSIPSVSAYVADGGKKDLPYSALADTFVLDIKTRVWQQVVTRTFPAWRSTAVLMIDDNGGIYLHGGISFREIHLGKRAREMDFFYFTDTWRLYIDFPGSPFDENLFLTPSTPFKAGCWRQCWVCKRIGTGYFKCQGSCKGQYIYCSFDCQRSSWETHRTVHKCRKRFY